MVCNVCNNKITLKQLFVKDGSDDMIYDFHVECHIKKFGDIKTQETQIANENKLTREQKVGMFSNYLFLIIMIIVVLSGFGVIIWISL